MAAGLCATWGTAVPAGGEPALNVAMTVAVRTVPEPVQEPAYARPVVALTML